MAAKWQPYYIISRNKRNMIEDLTSTFVNYLYSISTEYDRLKYSEQTKQFWHERNPGLGKLFVDYNLKV